MISTNPFNNKNGFIQPMKHYVNPESHCRLKHKQYRTQVSASEVGFIHIPLTLSEDNLLSCVATISQFTSLKLYYRLFSFALQGENQTN
jgi:hypothetical protein